jgi:hypothetical protein
MPNKRLHPGDLIIWTDGTPGVLLKRFDMYAKPEGLPSNHYPSYCWHIAFNGPTPRDYNEKYGALEVNMFNLGMVRRAQCKREI